MAKSGLVGWGVVAGYEIGMSFIALDNESECCSKKLLIALTFCSFILHIFSLSRSGWLRMN